MLEQIIQAIKDAESYGLLTDTGNETLTGLSGHKLVGSLQRLSHLFSENKKACYLEVGVFQGLTLLSVSNCSPNLSCYGIDNFAQFDSKGENLSIVNDRKKRLKLQNANVINEDYENALETLENKIEDKKVAVYFIDGPHDYRSQLMCLELILPYLHKNAVIVIDDSNYQHIRQANRDFLVTHPEYKLVFEAYTRCHPLNMTPIEEQHTREAWWNGVNIIVRDIENKLQPMYPPTQRSRILYENEHIIHSAKIAEVAPQAIAVMQSLYEMNFIEMIRNVFRFYQSVGQYRQIFNKHYKTANTSSTDFPAYRYNSLA